MRFVRKMLVSRPTPRPPIQKFAPPGVGAERATFMP